MRVTTPRSFWYSSDISPFLVLQRLRSIVAVSTARAFLRNAVISGSGLGGASYHWGLLIGSSVISRGAGMRDVPIPFGKLHGGLNENAGVRISASGSSLSVALYVTGAQDKSDVQDKMDECLSDWLLSSSNLHDTYQKMIDIMEGDAANG